jgi:CheY-like chemotaxis protein
MPTIPNPTTASAVVLLIDDEEAIRQTLSLALEFEGCQVFTASDGREGIEMLQRIPRPDLILLDLMMPVLDGWGFMEELQKKPEYSDIPVAIITAFSDRGGIKGTVAAIQKPVELDDLFELTRRYSKRGQSKNAA